MVIRNNSDSPSRTKQKEDKQMFGNSEMLEPGIQMVNTTRKRKAHHEPKHDEHPGVYCHDVIQSSKPVHTYERNGSWAGSRDLRQCMNIAAPAYDDSP